MGTGGREDEGGNRTMQIGGLRDDGSSWEVGGECRTRMIEMVGPGPSDA